MVDEPESTELEKLKADEEAARDALINAIVTYGRARSQVSYFEGYRQAQEDAKEHFAELANRLRSASPPSPSSGTEPALLELAVTEPRPTLPPANDIVSEAIKENPGLRGVALLDKIRESHPTLHERTFRTALHRLKMAREIYTERRCWYHKSHGFFAEFDGDPSAPKGNGGQQ